MFTRKQNFIRPASEGKNHSENDWWQILLIPLRLLPHIVLAGLFFLILAGVAAGFALAPYYASLKTVYREAQAGQKHLQAAENFIGGQKFELGRDELRAAEENFQAASAALNVAGKAAIFKSAFAGNQLAVAGDILAIGETASRSLKNIAEVGVEIKQTLKMDDISWLNITAEKKSQLLSALASSVDELELAQKEFQVAGEKLVEINKRQPLFIFDSTVQPLQTKIPKIQKTFDSLVIMAKLLPAFSGYPEEKTYLFVMENNREMRPAGGFIGTYGIVKIQNAEIKKIFTDNSYNFDQPAEAYLKIDSPSPMAKYMNQPKWFFRDANWWPDWPASAQKLVWFYKEQKGQEKLDGVIAITPTVVEDLLGVFGEFKVGDMTFNQQNFWEQLQYQVEYGYYKQGIPMAQRKDIISDLTKQMLARLYLMPMSKWSDMADIIFKSAKEKQLLFYFNDAAMQSLAVENGWAGEVKNFDGDYLMLVDANLAALKTDSVMTRTLSYGLSQNEQGEYLATARVNYQNAGSFSWKTTRYRSYTRLYVPAGSKLVSVKVEQKELPLEDVDIYNEFNKTAFGVFFEVEPQSSKQVEWVYKLPEDVAKKFATGEYSLLVQKQPGILQMNLQMDLTFPRNIVRETESLTSKKNNLKHIEVLTQDQIYTIWLE